VLQRNDSRAAVDGSLQRVLLLLRHLRSCQLSDEQLQDLVPILLISFGQNVFGKNFKLYVECWTTLKPKATVKMYLTNLYQILGCPAGVI
jgi:hypothetical protein